MLSSVSFLTALPAILGIAGFVIYYILKKSVTEDPTVRRIIDKLKFDEPDFENRWNGLTSTQKEALLKDDNELRSKLAVQDRAIKTNAQKKYLFMQGIPVAIQMFYRTAAPANR
ncbi:hypothetical protein [Filimonas effusa]|uniref:Uncharacterized protein n=1 Tax=Filimonas effusa TaxID=2508721 RepID=A0A4Q1DAK6_9BACT|nr:hypothetical protein [Filimonas effusa]RXK86280.1 hypothetical protein ESB13_05590 [Filimonas effusa]